MSSWKALAALVAVVAASAVQVRADPKLLPVPVLRYSLAFAGETFAQAGHSVRLLTQPSNGSYSQISVDGGSPITVQDQLIPGQSGIEVADCNQCGPAGLSYDASGALKVDVVAGGGGGVGGSPLTGGASGIATGPNQAVAIAAYNGSTLDALQERSGILLASQGAAKIYDLMSTTGAPGGPSVASGTCYNIKSSSAKLGYIWIAGSTVALSYTVTFFDDAGTTCSNTGTSATSYPLWTSGSSFAAGQIFPLDIPPTKNGLAFTITGTINPATPIFVSYL